MFIIKNWKLEIHPRAAFKMLIHKTTNLIKTIKSKIYKLLTIPVGHYSRPPEQKYLEQFAGPQLILEKTRMVTTNFKLCTMSVWPKNFDVHEQLLLQYYYNTI